MTNNQKIVAVGGTLAVAAVVYFGFVRKDASGLTAWAKMNGKTNPLAGKPVNPNSDEVQHEAAGKGSKVPRSKQGYWKNGSWYHY